jgi:hypothetical protein
MDVPSIVLAYVTGIFTAVVGYEYQRYRERSTRASERKNEVRGSLISELTKFVSGWQLFKNTSNMQVERGLANYRAELKQLGHAIRNILSVSGSLLQKDLVDDGMKISGDLIKMSLWDFYADGGISFNELIKFGDETARRCEALNKKLRT